MPVSHISTIRSPVIFQVLTRSNFTLIVFIALFLEQSKALTSVKLRSLHFQLNSLLKILSNISKFFKYIFVLFCVIYVLTLPFSPALAVGFAQIDSLLHQYYHNYKTIHRIQKCRTCSAFLSHFSFSSSLYFQVAQALLFFCFFTFHAPFFQVQSERFNFCFYGRCDWSAFIERCGGWRSLKIMNLCSRPCNLMGDCILNNLLHFALNYYLRYSQKDQQQTNSHNQRKKGKSLFEVLFYFYSQQTIIISIQVIQIYNIQQTMSHLPYQEPQEDDNQNQFLDQHSNTNIVERPHFFYQESNSRLDHSYRTSSEKKPQLGENSLSQAIHNEMESMNGLQSKKEEVEEVHDGQQNQENEFMLDENSLVASINKGLVKEQSDLESKMRNSSNMLVNNSNSSNPFGADSKVNQNQNSAKSHQNQESNFMVLNSNKMQQVSKKNSSGLLQESNQLINQSKKSKIHLNSSLKSHDVQKEPVSQEPQNLNHSNKPLQFLESEKNFINNEGEQSKPIQFLNNSFSKEEIVNKDSQLQPQSHQNIGLLNDLSQNIQENKYFQSIQSGSKAISNPFHEIEQINNFSSKISNKQKKDQSINKESLKSKNNLQSKDFSQNQMERVPSSMKKARKKSSKIVSQNIVSNLNSGLVDQSSIIKRIQVHNLSLQDRSVAKKKHSQNLQNESLEQIEENNPLLESQVIALSRQSNRQKKSQVSKNFPANELDPEDDPLNSNYDEEEEEQQQYKINHQPIEHQQIENQEQLINLSARILQPLEQKQASLSRSLLEENYQRKISVQYSLQLQEQEANKVSEQKQFSRQLKPNIQHNSQYSKNNSKIEAKSSLKSQQRGQRSKIDLLQSGQNSNFHHQFKQQASNQSIKGQSQKMGNQSIINSGGLIKQKQSSFKSQPEEKSFSQPQPLQSQLQVQERKEPEKSKLSQKYSEKSKLSQKYSGQMQQSRSANNLAAQVNNISNQNIRKSLSNQNEKKSFYLEEATTNHKIMSVNEDGQLNSYNRTELSSKHHAVGVLGSKEEINLCKQDKVGKEKYFKKPHIFNTFTENTELQAQNFEQSEKEEEQFGKYEKQIATPSSQVKLNPLSRDKVYSLKDRQFQGVRKKDKSVIQEENQKQSQIQRIRLLKQAHKKRLQRQLEKVRKQLEEINYKEKKMDKIYQQKHRLQVQQKLQKIDGRHLSRNQQRHKRQSEDVMKLVKEHKLQKRQQQIEFSDLDRNITNNLMQLSRIRQQAQQKLKEKKRMEIAERMKRKQLQKMNELKQMNANKQYVQQFKSAEPKNEEKIKSPYKEVSNNLLNVYQKRKSNESEQNLLMPNSAKKEVKLSKQQHKSGKLIKFRSIGKKLDEDRYENKLN